MSRTETIRQLLEATDLVALVQEKTKLKKAGSGWMGACPIHKGGTATPCFSVIPSKGIFHCFSCLKGGDALDFIQETQGMSLDEAMEELSARTGIALPTKREVSGPENGILATLDAVQGFYTSCLTASSRVMDYLLGSRGMTRESIQAEGLGFAPAGWTDTIQHLEKRGIASAQAEAAGITARTGQGRLIDLIRDRLTIPIRDGRGKVIAFSGRNLPGSREDSPKYINTRETPVFKKSGVLYHLREAKGLMREEGAVVVEGYFDVISLYTHGVQTAVAPMGTALTQEHLQAISRWTKRITLAFDGDKAGREATKRSLEMALPLGFDVRLLRLPDGEDPDSWARQVNGDTRPRIMAAPDWGAFALAKAREGRDLRRLDDRMAAAAEMSKWLIHLPPGRQKEVQLAAAHDLNVPPESIRILGQGSDPAPSHAIATQMEGDEAIQSLLAMTTRGNAFLEWVQSIPRSWWEWRSGAQPLEALLDLDGDADGLDPSQQSALRAAEARESTRAQPDPKRLMLRLEREFLQREMADLAKRLGESSDDAQGISIQAQLTELRARSARLIRGAK